MDNAIWILTDVVSAVLCFVLVRYMTKPYQYTCESRYVGLPLGFVFLGLSYIFAGLALFSDSPLFVENMKWLYILTQSYAFAFLAVTYYFSKQQLKRSTRILWQFIWSLMIIGMIISYLIVSELPLFALPSYKTADEYFRVLNIMLASYIAILTLRSHALNPDSKTIRIPLGYVLLVFNQYSSLIWTLDSSFSAFVGAHIIRLAGLMVFLIVSYKTFATSRNLTTTSKGFE